MSGTPAAPVLTFVFNDAGFFLSHRGGVARAAARAGFVVHVATASGPAVQEVERAGFTHHAIPLSRSGTGLRGEIATLSALRTLYSTLRPDLVEHATIKPVLYGSVAARLARVGAVVNWVTGLGHLFDPHYRFAAMRRTAATRAYRTALRLARSEVIVENRSLLRFMADEVRVPPDRLSLIHGAGVDVRAFAPADEGEPRDDPRLTFVLAARMLWTKGVGEFVDAARVLRAETHCARFVLVGAPDPGNLAGIPEARLREWMDEGTIEWWGHRTDMPAVFARADVVVLPSYGEGLPKVLAEAAAAGKPLIATLIPGCLEVVRPGENGYAVPVRDSRALAAAMQSMIDMSPSARGAMGERSRALAVQRFAEETIIEQTMQVYRRAIARRGAR